MNSGDQKHARLFGYLRTDAEGKFELTTIRPEGYPRTELPQHIHVHVDVGGVERLVTEIKFTDDPRVTEAWTKRSIAEGADVVPVDETGEVQLVVTRLVLRAHSGAKR